MTNFTKYRRSQIETDGDVLMRLGTDGAKWAAEFKQVALRLGHSDMDEGWLICWFANAIEAGRGVSAQPVAPDRGR